MKKAIKTIIMLAAAGSFAHAALASDNTAPPGFCIVQDGHGGYHSMYYQNVAQQDPTVALYTSSGGVAPATLESREGPLPDNGNVRFVIGTNQHGQANAAYIPATSHFGQASQ